MAVKVLVTGSNGQLGQELRAISSNYDGLEFEFFDRSNLDLGAADSIINTLRKSKPDYVINCAAYTKVDQAEDEPDAAYEVNTKALEYLSESCNECGATLVHISSDYVYDSVNNRLLLENDPCEPKGVYAVSKKNGEEIIELVAAKWIIIRTSWVYSSFGNNFVKTMLKLGVSKTEISVVNDQIGAPTYARDLAEVIFKMIQKVDSEGTNNSLKNEIYNFSNRGQTSWDKFARKIFEHRNMDCHVTGISTDVYGAKAPRPLWSVMSTEKIEAALNFKIRNWETALVECLDLLKK